MAKNQAERIASIQGMAELSGYSSRVWERSTRNKKHVVRVWDEDGDTVVCVLTPKGIQHSKATFSSGTPCNLIEDFVLALYVVGVED